MNQLNLISQALEEAISSTSFPKVSKLIQSYLRKNLGTQKVYLFPVTEHFKSGGKVGTGIRFFINNIESVRFNWLSDGSISDSKNLVSFDYWDGLHGEKPTYHIEFDKAQSLVKSLPMVVNFLKAPRLGEILYIEDESLIESVIMNMTATFTNLEEARSTGGDATQTIVNVINAFSQGLQLKDIYATPGTIGPGHDKVCKTIRSL